jgi:hypothetical protein
MGKAAAWCLLAGAAAGGAGGWVTGRNSVEPPPPPPSPIFRNPLAEVAVGESLVLALDDGVRVEYLVREVTDHTVRIAVETRPKGGNASGYTMVASRNFQGFLTVLHIDDPEKQELASLTMTDVVVSTMKPETITILGRTFSAWRIEGAHRVLGPMTYWVSDAAPVHGLVAMESGRGKRWEIESWSFGEKPGK